MLKQLVNNYLRGFSIGLNPFKIIYLKHAKNKWRHHPLFGKRFCYINGYDFLHSLHEIFLDQVYKIDLGEKPVIIDCGANIGLSLLYFKRKHPDAHVIAFEPDNTNYDLISNNIKTYGLSNVDLRKEAVWSKNEVLHFKSVNSLGSMITKEMGNDTYEVKAVRLKDILPEKVGLLKMDIEGAEYEVIKDIEDSLCNIDNMFIEYHGSFDNQDQLNEILNLMTDKGFKYYIKEATNIFPTPFSRNVTEHPYDIQLNIFCFR